jgi:multiple sugar transport system substrate-binding protein
MNNRVWASSALAIGMVVSLSACGGGSSFNESDSGTGSAPAQDASSPLTVLIGSSGDAETNAVNDAVAAWAEENGTEAEVVVASDLNQQLSQGFSSGEPADVFYLSTDALAGYASNGSLLAYGDELANKDDFYPSLVEAFTYDGDFYCAPKDFSTLQLVINTDLWEEAGLTDADIPTTWDELASVAEQLTDDDTVGLAMGAEYQRVGVFMAQAGSNLMSDDNTEATANSPENLEALEFVQEQLTAGNFAFAADVDAGWGGEAFGTQKSAMTIEGNWITGAMQNDFPDVNYTVAELPEGPAGKGTLQFTNCWGIAADSDNQDGARGLVEYLTSTDQQLAFSEAFGPMPSIQSAADQWSSENELLVPFLNGADYAKTPPTLAGSADVVADFNSQISSLKDGDPAAILESTQSNLEALLP